MSQSETTSATGGPLWCMHIQGPDDLHAAPDFWTALAWAAELNSFIAEKAAKGNWKADDNYPLSQAVVRQWTGSRESHAVQCEIELADRAEHEAKRKEAALAAPTAKGGTEVTADPLVAYLERQWAWSKETFGPALRTKGIVQHITKELREIEADPHDLAEWVDVIILAMDGFWRHGGKPSDLLPVMQRKQDINFARTWPDWRTMSEDQAIEHDRSGEASPPPPAGAAGGSGPLNWTLSQETKDHIAEIERATIAAPWNPGYTSFDGTYHGPSPVLAGAAGGGSGDLAALSAGATPGRLYAQPYDPEDTQFGICLIAMPDDVPDGATPTNGLVFVSTLLPSEMPIDDFSGDPRRAQANADFVKALWNAYRSGRLVEAPTPDLGAQGEPVAWAWETWKNPGDTPITNVSVQRPSKAAFRHNIRPLYEVPAAPRPGSRVSVEEIARIVLRYIALDLKTPASMEAYSRAAAEQILALIAQAPRDGGETR